MLPDNDAAGGAFAAGGGRAYRHGLDEVEVESS
jgi:hypothetical protein